MLGSMIYYMPHRTSDFTSNNHATYITRSSVTYIEEAHFHAFLNTQREDGTSVCAMIFEMLKIFFLFLDSFIYLPVWCMDELSDYIKLYYIIVFKYIDIRHTTTKSWHL